MGHARDGWRSGDGLESGGNVATKMLKTPARRKRRNCSPFYLRGPQKDPVFRQWDKFFYGKATGRDHPEELLDLHCVGQMCLNGMSTVKAVPRQGLQKIYSVLYFL